jgi:hypothetical protein
MNKAKLKKAIKFYKNKIKKQDLIQNERDINHLNKLIKVYNEIK